MDVDETKAARHRRTSGSRTRSGDRRSRATAPITAVRLFRGAGLVQRHGNNVVVVSHPSHDGFAAAVLSECRELSGTDLIRRLADRLLDLAPSERTTLGVVTTAARGPLVLLHGDIELRTDGEIVSAAGLVTGVEVALDDVPWLSVVPGGTDGPVDERTDLTDGVVAASGFHLEFAPFPPPVGHDTVLGPDRMRLTPGAVIRLRDREMVFESHDLLERKAS